MGMPHFGLLNGSKMINYGSSMVKSSMVKMDHLWLKNGSSMVKSSIFLGWEFHRFSMR